MASINTDDEYHDADDYDDDGNNGRRFAFRFDDTDWMMQYAQNLQASVEESNDMITIFVTYPTPDMLQYTFPTVAPSLGGDIQQISDVCRAYGEALVQFFSVLQSEIDECIDVCLVPDGVRYAGLNDPVREFATTGYKHFQFQEDFRQDLVGGLCSVRGVDRQRVWIIETFGMFTRTEYRSPIYPHHEADCVVLDLMRHNEIPYGEGKARSAYFGRDDALYSDTRFRKQATRWIVPFYNKLLPDMELNIAGVGTPTAKRKKSKGDVFVFPVMVPFAPTYDVAKFPSTCEVPHVEASPRLAAKVPVWLIGPTEQFQAVSYRTYFKGRDTGYGGEFENEDDVNYQLNSEVVPPSWTRRPGPKGAHASDDSSSLRRNRFLRSRDLGDVPFGFEDGYDDDDDDDNYDDDDEESETSEEMAVNGHLTFNRFMPAYEKTRAWQPSTCNAWLTAELRHQGDKVDWRVEEARDVDHPDDHEVKVALLPAYEVAGLQRHVASWPGENCKMLNIRLWSGLVDEPRIIEKMVTGLAVFIMKHHLTSKLVLPSPRARAVVDVGEAAFYVRTHQYRKLQRYREDHGCHNADDFDHLAL